MTARRGLSRAAMGLVILPFAVPAAEAPPGASSCAGCHGRTSALIPPLRGQSPEAIAEAMREYRGGTRPATLMDRIAKGFTEEETRAIAAWVSVAP